MFEGKRRDEKISNVRSVESRYRLMIIPGIVVGVLEESLGWVVGSCRVV